MKTNKIQNTQAAKAAKPPRSEESASQKLVSVSKTHVDDLRAYVPAGAAMAPSSASPSVEPQRRSSSYFSEDDIEMNRRVHGDFETESETDYEDEVDPDLEDDLDSDEEESTEFAEDEEEEASESGHEVTLSVKEIVRNINHIAFGYVERGKMEIGHYVLQVVFKDKIDEVLSKNPSKTESLRKICDDPELRVDRRRLSNWVRAAALHRDLEANSVDCSGIMTSQLVALMKVKDKDNRRELAEAVSREGLTVRDIMKKAEMLNQNGNSKTVAKVLRKKIENPLSLLADEEAIALLRDQQRLADEIPYKDRTEIITAIDAVAKQMDESKTFLDEVRDNLFLVDMERLRRREA